MFYTKEVKIYKLEQVVDEWGTIGESKYVLVKSLPVDIQPYSQDKLNRDYGYDLETTKRMFCDIDNSVDEASLVLYRGKAYRVVKIVEWDDYLDIALNDALGVDLIG